MRVKMVGRLLGGVGAACGLILSWGLVTGVVQWWAAVLAVGSVCSLAAVLLWASPVAHRAYRLGYRDAVADIAGEPEHRARLHVVRDSATP